MISTADILERLGPVLTHVSNLEKLGTEVASLGKQLKNNGDSETGQQLVLLRQQIDVEVNSIRVILANINKRVL